MTGLLERPVTPAAPPLAIRAAVPEDREAVRAFLARLSLDSAYRRFFTGLGSPSPALVRRLVEVDHEHRETVLAVLGGEPGGVGSGGDGPGGEVVGLADCSRLTDGATVELGVVVADAWQRQGLGPRLARAVLGLAAARGATTVRMHALAENGRVARLVRRAWPDGVPGRDGSILVWTLPLPPRDSLGPATAGGDEPRSPAAGH